MVPPLVGAVQVTARLLANRPLSEMLGWLRLLALYDVVFVTLCTMIFAGSGRRVTAAEAAGRAVARRGLRISVTALLGAGRASTSSHSAIRR